jgi:hypothetical protein
VGTTVLESTDRVAPILRRLPQPPAELTADEQATAGLAPEAVAAAPSAAPVVVARSLDPLVLRAYQQAEAAIARSDRSCGMSWQVLAGIGRVESNNGAGRTMTPDGTLSPILGPALDGGPGLAAIRDGDGWARATGPMQFLPSTWRSWGADGNGDGVADPHNVFDAALAAGHYLCAGTGSLTDPPALARALFSYNHSDDYVTVVLRYIAAYRQAPAEALLTAAGYAAPATIATAGTLDVSPPEPPASGPEPAAAPAATPGSAAPTPTPGPAGTTPPAPTETAPLAQFALELDNSGGVLSVRGEDVVTPPVGSTRTVVQEWVFTVESTTTPSLRLDGPVDGTWSADAPVEADGSWVLRFRRTTVCYGGAPCRLSAALTGARPTSGSLVAARHTLTVNRPGTDPVSVSRAADPLVLGSSALRAESSSS